MKFLKPKKDSSELIMAYLAAGNIITKSKPRKSSPKDDVVIIDISLLPPHLAKKHFPKI